MTLPDPVDILPHRGRWRLVDTIEAIGEDYVVASFLFDRSFAQGHFPEKAVVPGVALAEGLAQTMLCMGADKPRPEGFTPLLMGMDRVRFRAPVFPPARVQYTVKFVSVRARVTTCRGTATVDGKRVCTATLMGLLAAIDGR